MIPVRSNRGISEMYLGTCSRFDIVYAALTLSQAYAALTALSQAYCRGAFIGCQKPPQLEPSQNVW